MQDIIIQDLINYSLNKEVNRRNGLFLKIKPTI